MCLGKLLILHIRKLRIRKQQILRQLVGGGGFLSDLVVKNLLMQEIRVQSLGQEDPLEKVKTHSSILAWEIPQTEEPGWLQSMGFQRVRHNSVTKQ